MSIEDQPNPKSNDGESMHDLVIRDMEDRKQVGLERYGTILQAFNGRKPLIDAYQEVLDLIVYLRQEIEERAGTVPIGFDGIPLCPVWFSREALKDISKKKPVLRVSAFEETWGWKLTFQKPE